MKMTDEQLRRIIRKQAVNGKVNCREMLQLAKQVGLPANKIGKLCDQMNLRIAACQLGCF